jgi:hypothetical protein
LLDTCVGAKALSGGYDESCLQQCSTVQSIESQPIFQRNILHQELRSKPSTKPAWRRQQTKPYSLLLGILLDFLLNPEDRDMSSEVFLQNIIWLSMCYIPEGRPLLYTCLKASVQRIQWINESLGQYIAIQKYK